jgi:hypothetical protein
MTEIACLQAFHNHAQLGAFALLNGPSGHGPSRRAEVRASRVLNFFTSPDKWPSSVEMPAGKRSWLAVAEEPRITTSFARIFERAGVAAKLGLQVCDHFRDMVG